MAHRIEVSSIIPDTRATVRKRHLESLGFAGRVEDVNLVDVYTVDSSLKEGDFILKEKVEVVYEKVVTKFGTSGKLDAPKKYIGKRAYVIIVH